MAPRRRIREVYFRGSHFERGRQRGRRLRRTFVIPQGPCADPGFVRACFEATAAVFPQAIEEFEGLVEGGGFDRGRLMAYYFARTESQLGAPCCGCTMFAVEAAQRACGDGPVVGRNYDWATADLRWCELHRYAPPGGPRRLGYTHHWAGCADVLSESGLYVAIASLPPVGVWAPGLQWNVIVDMLTETCATVEEAARLCGRVRHLRPMSYLLADARGAAAVVEATPSQVRCRAGHGLVVAANAPQGGELLKDWTGEPTDEALPKPLRPNPPNYSDDAVARARRRIRRAEQMLRAAAPGVTMRHVEEVLADHEAPICTGDHSRPDGGRWATIWSGICEPARGAFAIAPGLPCRHPYQRFTLGAA